MKPLVKWGPVFLSLALMALAIWLEWSLLGERGSLLLFAFINLILFVDFFDFIVRLPRRHTEDRKEQAPSAPEGPARQEAAVQPFAIVASLYNAEKELDTLLHRLAPFQQNVWFVDDASSDRTVAQLRQRGWRCLEGSPNRKKPAALQQLIQQLPDEVKTVMVIDPDIGFDHLEQPVVSLKTTIRQFQESGCAALSPRLLVSGPGVLERFQSFEYCLTFDLTRQSLRGCCATSGIALYRREALEQALASHSLSVYAEDLENALLLMASGEQIDYDRRLVVRTEAPKRWRGWFSQRVGWSFGLIRTYHLCWPLLRRFKLLSTLSYQYLIYIGLFCLLLHPLKLLSAGLLLASLLFSLIAPLFEGALSEAALTTWLSVAGVYLRYTLLVFLAWLFIVPRTQKRSLLAVIPTYFLYVCALLIPTTAGYGNWYSLRFLGRRIYRDHYQEESALRRQFYRSLAPENL